jgi:PAS domain-containing protein
MPKSPTYKGPDKSGDKKICREPQNTNRQETSGEANRILKERISSSPHAHRDEKQRLSALLDSIQDEVWFADKGGHFVLVNRAGLQEFYPIIAEEKKVEKIAASLEVYRPDGTPRPVDEAPPLRALRGETVRKQEEIIRTPATGELRHRQVSAAPVKDVDGSIIGSISVVRDITDQKQTEAALRQLNAELERRVSNRTAELEEANEKVQAERQRLLDVLETVPVMIRLLTPDYHVAFANRSFREKFGESHGRHCYEYGFGLDKPCEFCESYRVLEMGQPHHWEFTVPGGSIIDAYDYPFTDVDGSPIILEMDIDITERRRAEAALREVGAYNRTLIEVLRRKLNQVS